MARNSPRKLILAIDQGTTSTKAVLLDAGLRVIGEASREFSQHFPRPGWVEHEPEEIWRSVRGAVLEVLRRSRVSASRLGAIGVANQRETTIVWDRSSGRPVHRAPVHRAPVHRAPVYRAIVWQDRRTAADCERLKAAGHEQLFRRRTGLVLDPYFSGTKLAWILRNVRGVRARARTGAVIFGTVDTYLAWRLSGGRSHVTDVSNASRTLLLDLRTRRWDEELCRILDVPPRMLPAVRGNDEVYGTTRDTGFLPEGIPIASLVGDQQAALFGQTCFRDGEAKCTYGTGAFLVLNTGPRIVHSRHGLLSTIAWQLGGRPCYALEGSAFIAGALVQWLRDGLGIIRSSDEIESLARSVPDSGGVTLVPALTGLGAPYWEPHARGLLGGLTRGATRAHVARAALEGIAFQILDLVRAMERDVGRSLRSLRVDGGAARDNLLLQFQADILRTRVIRPRITSTTALGAALLAGLATGIFSSLAAIREVWREEKRFNPVMKAGEASRHVARWEDAVRRARL
jgi:glycerol kinase